ncbi:7tm 6 domain containing protein, partial [Asbolus verrucosus]
AVAITTLTSIHLLIEENVDIVQISDSSFLIIQVGCLIFKLLPFIHDGDGIRKNINKLENSLFAVYSEKQKRFMEDCKKNCQQVTWLFFGFCILSLILFTLIPLLGRSRNFPIEIWLPFEAKLQLLTYVTSYILITAGIGIDTLTNGVIDTLISGLACFAATQLRILRDNLQHLDQYCSQETSNEVPSNTITSSIYMSNWYDYDINSKKALIILMERSQKPVIVSAGKILDLSLTTFTTILRRAYSLFAVLKNY